MVKDPNLEENQSIDYNEVASVVTKSVVTCILVYVGADTLRRAAIYAMTTKY
jgi:hypothetical protein